MSSGRRWSRATALVAGVALLASLVACGGGGGDGALCEQGACEVCPCSGCPAEGFDPHTRSAFTDDADLSAWCGDADEPPGSATCKLLVSGLSGRSAPAVHVYDRRFFHFHDEFFWYRLLNGAPLPGCPKKPLGGMAFDSVAAIVAQATQMKPSRLPLDLGWAGERLYSTTFYDWSVRFTSGTAWARPWYAGTLRRFPPNPERKVPGRVWAIEGEFVDKPTAADVHAVMATLRERLPADIRGDLYWLARSTPHQEGLARVISAGDSELKGRCLTIADLQVDGEVQVVQAGVTAGKVLRVRASDLGAVVPGPEDIVVLDGVPDDLPPVAGILTAAPQPAQAHIALLARARGTPDAYVQGIWDDPQIIAWAAARTPVALQLVEGEAPRFVPLSAKDWAVWQQLKTGGPTRVAPRTKVGGLPVVQGLGGASQADRRRLLASVGGKAAGLAVLVDRALGDTPPGALALTVRGYVQHVAGLAPSIAAVLADPALGGESLEARRWRFAALEGREAFDERQSAEARAWLAAQLAPGATGAEVSEVVRAAVEGGGVRGWIRQQPVDPAWLSAVIDALQARWGGLAPTQGLRFRSSATVEDLDGFTAAGVYSSHTGYLRPWLHPLAGERHKTVERAIRRVWAALYRYEAVEERRLAGFAPVDARMAVLVHPSFGDQREAANGVALVKVRRTPLLGGGVSEAIETVIEAQVGALSVTNPTSAHVPERHRLSEVVLPAAATPIGDPAAGVAWQRQQTSSEAAVVLTEPQARALHRRLAPVARRWLAEHNAALPPAWRRGAVQLDVEWRLVKPDWPEGTGAPGRMVVKQVRPFGPRRKLAPADLGSASAPEDLFDAAISASLVTCSCGPDSVQTWQLRTDPGWPEFPHSDAPFVAHARWSDSEDASHLELSHAEATGAGRALGVSLTLGPAAAARWGVAKVEVTHGQPCVVDGAERPGKAKCFQAPLATGPVAWLLDKLSVAP